MRHATESAFNINALSDRGFLTLYRFRRQDVLFASDLIICETSIDPQGNIRTMRRRYRVKPVEENAIFFDDWLLRLVGFAFSKNLEIITPRYQNCSKVNPLLRESVMFMSSGSDIPLGSCRWHGLITLNSVNGRGFPIGFFTPS
jgi:hypothetical protein